MVIQKARELCRNDREILLLRDESVELERAIDLVHSDAKDGLDFVTAETSVKQAHTSHCATVETRRLNSLVAFFFPLVTLIGLFGINNPVLILTSISFWLIVILGLLLGWFLERLVFQSSTKDKQP